MAIILNGIPGCDLMLDKGGHDHMLAEIAVTKCAVETDPTQCVVTMAMTN
jgi:hypothetical protein